MHGHANGHISIEFCSIRCRLVIKVHLLAEYPPRTFPPNDGIYRLALCFLALPETCFIIITCFDQRYQLQLVKTQLRQLGKKEKKRGENRRLPPHTHTLPHTLCPFFSASPVEINASYYISKQPHSWCTVTLWLIFFFLIHYHCDQLPLWAQITVLFFVFFLVVVASEESHTVKGGKAIYIYIYIHMCIYCFTLWKYIYIVIFHSYSVCNSVVHDAMMHHIHLIVHILHVIALHELNIV